MEEAKRCELKLPVEIKRTACIHCGGCVPTGAIASRNPVKEEKVPTPVRRSARIRGMKWKDYKEVSPEPKNYGDSDYSNDRSPSSWAEIGPGLGRSAGHRLGREGPRPVGPGRPAQPVLVPNRPPL
jgi:ferredoxin